MTTPTMSMIDLAREKWKDVMEADGVAPITNTTVRNNVIRLLENQVNIGGQLHEMGVVNEANFGTVAGTPAGDTNTASVTNWDPILIQLVRRTQPSLVANRLMGVQPMSGPTGLIFSMRTFATGNQSGDTTTELYAPGTVPDPELGGSVAPSDNKDSMTTAEMEALGYVKQVTNAGAGTDPVLQASPWAEVSFTIDQMSVTAKGKALKARYTTELAHDLRQIHGLDADTELSNILSGELVAEQNREVVNTLFDQAIITLKTSGGTYSHASSGGYDFYNYLNKVAVEGEYDLAVDSDGRWEGEHFRNLIGMINRVAHEVALGTRRGLGNVIITDPITASAIDSAGRTTGPADNAGGLEFSHDNVGVMFAGRLLGRYDVFVDPYMFTQQVLVGYKGANAYDAGYFYCPYVPLTVMRTIGAEDMQPRIGFKTRYGMVHNPFVAGTTGTNWYYRKFTVKNV